MAATPGRGSKNKGANAEREVAKLFQPIMDKVYKEFGMMAPEMKRNLEQTRGGGYDLVGLDWLALEVKRCETLQLNKWWEQTLRQATVHQEPVLIYRQNNQKWKIVMFGGLKIVARKWLRVKVEVSLDDFKRYLENRIRHELQDQEI